MTGRASDCGRGVRTASGATTSCERGRATGGPSACSTASTSTPASAWPSTWPGGRSPTTCWSGCRSCPSFRGVPEHIRSDDGPEFTAEAVRGWPGRVGVETLFIEPGQPVGERLRRELQRQAVGRAAGPRGVRHAAGGEGANRAVAAGPTTPCGRIAARAIARRHPRRSRRGRRLSELRSSARRLWPRRSRHYYRPWHHWRGQVKTHRDSPVRLGKT